MPKKIIFDLDGTLLFLSIDWDNVYQNFIDKYKLNIKSKELYDTIGDFETEYKNKIITKKMLCDYVTSKTNLSMDVELLDNLLDMYKDIPLLSTQEAYDILDYLSKKYTLVAYSNWFSDNQNERLKKYDLDKFFTEIYGWDKVLMKPSEEGLKSIIKDNDINDYIFVGDNLETDLSIPKKLGMKTIFINRNNVIQTEHQEVASVKYLKNIL